MIRWQFKAWVQKKLIALSVIINYKILWQTDEYTGLHQDSNTVQSSVKVIHSRKQLYRICSHF